MAFANLVVEVGLNGSVFERGVSKVIAKAQEMSAALRKGVTSIATNQISQAFAVAAVINKLQAGVSEAIAFGSSILNLSKELNVSTDVLQLWNYAAKTTGATMGDVEAMFLSLGRSAQNAANGTPETIAAFKKLGVTIDDVKNKKPEDIARLIGKAFESKGADPTKLEGALRDVGGRGAHALIAAFKNGIGATFDEGLKLKIAIDADELEKMSALGDKLEIFQMEMRPVFFGFAVAFTKIIEVFYDGVKLFVAAAMDIKGNIQDINGLNNIKNPQIKEQVAARKAGVFGDYRAAPAIIQTMRSEKMDELDKLNKKQKEFNKSNNTNNLYRDLQLLQLKQIESMNYMDKGIDPTATDAKEQIERTQSNIDARFKEMDAVTSLIVKANETNVAFKTEKDKLQAELKDITTAYVAPFSAVNMLVQEKIDKMNAEAKALEVARAKRAETKLTKPLVDESIPKKLRPVKDAELLPKITDSLSKVGGFTMGRDVISLTVAKQQLAVLETIADNTKDIKPPEGDGLP